MLHLVKQLEKYTNKQITLGMFAISGLMLVVGLVFWQMSGSNIGLFNNNSQPIIATTIFPLTDISRNIMGPEAQIIQLLPSGASPHTYELSPQQVSQLSKAKVLFAIGHGLDNWAVEFAKNNGIEVVYVDTDIVLLESDHQESEGEKDEEHSDDEFDPHYWLTIPNGMLISRNIKNSLIEIFPNLSEEFEINHNKYSTRLAKTDIELRRLLANKSTQSIAVYHNAWQYLARNYGLEIVAVFEEVSGGQPSPEYVKNFQDQIKAYSLSTIFFEPEFSTDSIRPIANDLGVRLVMLDPLGGSDTTPSYEEMLRYNINQIASQL